MDEFFSTLLAVIITGFFGLAFFSPVFEKQEETRKDIIEKTEKYEKYDYCEKIDNKWYCFNVI